MITDSVGVGGANVPADVTQIQVLLNERNSAGLTVDGVYGPATEAAIMAFQRLVRGVTTPDGLVSPDGPTFAALSGGPLPSASTPATQPSFPGSTCMLLDLSHYQEVDPINFAALAQAGVAAILLKATQGTGYQDSTFAARLRAAQAAGMPVGAYHFGTPDDPGAQVDHFVRTVTGAGGDFHSVVAALDVEASGGISVTQAEAWVEAFTRRTGAKPLIYGGSDYLGANGGATGQPNMATCPLWVAAYPNSPAARPSAIPGWADWTLWQHTTGAGGCYAGSVGGVTSDRSIFRGTAQQLAAVFQGLVSQAAGGA
jgi:GH25 family lysozyme M1 (1,4-beta-N-acetylmuramidase)